ncbi:MAG: type II toxin-antitoxin system Phd/YefM family antitoxin [Erysipelotrichaceae bacterium]|nr:type II toxin-antitoxin system Phd/YefM family antitoxin [Erysipelotrichaceae bacterium]
MKKITVTEFRRNFSKYTRLAQAEELVVTRRGKTIYQTYPGRRIALDEFKSLLGSLPADATIGVDPCERS